MTELVQGGEVNQSSGDGARRVADDFLNAGAHNGEMRFILEAVQLNYVAFAWRLLDCPQDRSIEEELRKR